MYVLDDIKPTAYDRACYWLQISKGSSSFRLVLALDFAHQLSQWLFQLFSLFTGSNRQNEHCGFDTWEILASPLKQLLITGRVNVVATTSLPGFSLAESRSAFIQTCSLGELWPLSDPITFVKDPHLPISAGPAVDVIFICLASTT